MFEYGITTGNWLVDIGILIFAGWGLSRSQFRFGWNTAVDKTVDRMLDHLETNGIIDIYMDDDGEEEVFSGYRHKFKEGLEIMPILLTFLEKEVTKQNKEATTIYDQLAEYNTSHFNYKLKEIVDKMYSNN